MASKIYECIEKIGNRIIEEKEFLTELDREIGDADHGINMARGFTEVLGVLPKDSDNIGELLKKTGMTLLSKVGGASGPLYGTARQSLRRQDISDSRRRQGHFRGSDRRDPEARQGC